MIQNHQLRGSINYENYVSYIFICKQSSPNQMKMKPTDYYTHPSLAIYNVTSRCNYSRGPCSTTILALNLPAITLLLLAIILKLGATSLTSSKCVINTFCCSFSPLEMIKEYIKLQWEQEEVLPYTTGSIELLLYNTRFSYILIYDTCTTGSVI